MEKVYIHDISVNNTNASSQVVPILIDMFKCSSVLDVGCGTGTWLKSFADCGVADIMGIDGDFVDRKLLTNNIPEKYFLPYDLTTPFDLAREFDLVISLEVAEHLPPESAEGFIKSLVKHGNTIVFSAAVPGQGGQNHLNEQWKYYWTSLFMQFGYKAFDLIRPLIWNNVKVDWWYKQNIIVFSQQEIRNIKIDPTIVLDTIHPDLFKQNQDYIIYLQEYVKDLELKLYPPKD